MKVIDHTKFAMCEYNQKVCNNPFELGDIVIHKKTKEVGVVIQIHDDLDLRVDMFGNSYAGEIRIATVYDIEGIKSEVRKKRIIDSMDLFQVTEILPKEVQEIIEKYSEREYDYTTCSELEYEFNQLGYSMEYGLDAVPFNLRKIGTKHFEFNSK